MRYYFLKLPTWIVFIGILAIYFIALILELKYIFTDEFYLNSFNGSSSIDSITDFISKERREEWVNFIVVLLVVLIPTSLISFALNIGCVFNNLSLRYVELFRITLKAHLIFSVNYLLSVLLKIVGLIEFHFESVNNNYYYQSLAKLLNHEYQPFWKIYIAQQINVSQLIHLLFLSYGVSLILKYTYNRTVGFVVIYYGSSYIIWIVFSIFLFTLLTD